MALIITLSLSVPPTSSHYRTSGCLTVQIMRSWSDTRTDNALEYDYVFRRFQVDILSNWRGTTALHCNRHRLNCRLVSVLATSSRVAVVSCREWANNTMFISHCQIVKHKLSPQHKLLEFQRKQNSLRFFVFAAVITHVKHSYRETRTIRLRDFRYGILNGLFIAAYDPCYTAS